MPPSPKSGARRRSAYIASPRLICALEAANERCREDWAGRDASGATDDADRCDRTPELLQCLTVTRRRATAAPARRLLDGLLHVEMDRLVRMYEHLSDET